MSKDTISDGTTWQQINNLQHQMRAIVVGQKNVVDRLLIALLADGHVLLEGPPGLAKTRLARSIADAFGGVFNRIQFTPDLLPSDLSGAVIYNASDHSFVFRKGPIFSNFLLADEINRAPAKVQSALLEAMEERQVSSGDNTYPLETPFLTIATQNPLEHDGTWDLPQAQLDRFLMHLRVDYPERQSELEILNLVMDESRKGPADPQNTTDANLSLDVLREAQRAVSNVHLSDPVRTYIVSLIAGTRSDPVPIEGVGEHLSHPASPRGSITLARAGQARAWLEQRDHVLPEDIQALAPDILRHRIGLSFRAEADGITADTVIARLLEKTDVL